MSKTTAEKVREAFAAICEAHGAVASSPSATDMAIRLAHHFRHGEIPGLDLSAFEDEADIPLDSELRWILGRPCFVLAGMADMLRRSGQVVAKKAEDEQAVAIHFMLNLYRKHGPDKWRDECEQRLKEIDSALKGDRE